MSVPKTFEAFPGFQTRALAFEDCDEKLLGGGRGSGKTALGMVWLAMPPYVDHPMYRALVIRRQAVDLADWVDRAREFYKPFGATVVGASPEVRFPSGAIIRTGHLGDPDSYTRYQGQEFARIVVEEASHIPSEDLYEKLIASCRSTIPELKPRVLLTANPTESGARWLKKRFGIMGPHDRLTTDQKTGRTRLYLHSTIRDNPALLQDQNYVNYLESLSDPELKKAWLEGDWDAMGVKGAIYGDLISLARRQGRIKPFEPDPFLPVYTAWDLGWDDMTAVVFAQIAFDGIRIIDSMEFTQTSLEEICVQVQTKRYAYAQHLFPHDIKVHEMSSGRTRFEAVSARLGFERCMIVPRMSGSKTKGEVAEGIALVRAALGRCWFNEPKTLRLVEALDNYRRQYDEALNVYREKPVHDSSCHFADAIRYLIAGTATMTVGLVPGQYSGQASFDPSLGQTFSSPLAGGTVKR